MHLEFNNHLQGNNWKRSKRLLTKWQNQFLIKECTKIAWLGSEGLGKKINPDIINIFFSLNLVTGLTATTSLCLSQGYYYNNNDHYNVI